MNFGEIWMLHSVEDDSPRTETSAIFRRLTVPPADLERRVVETRAAGREFVRMSELVAGLGNRRENGRPIPVAITIDDGFRNIYTDAFPVFRRLGVPFTFYVSTALIEQGFRDCPYPQLDGMMILCDKSRELGVPFDRLFRRYRRLKRWLWFLDGHKVMELMFGKGIDFGRYHRETVCSPAELREMADSGLCQFGSHTHNHVHVDRIGAKRLERELSVSKRLLEEWTGQPCTTFSFPYGHSSARAVEVVRRYFDNATCDVREPPYEVTGTSDRHLLPRKLVGRCR